jgi:hypothetical protein
MLRDLLNNETQAFIKLLTSVLGCVIGQKEKSRKTAQKNKY